MVSKRTRALLVTSTWLSGLLAGGTVDRAVVQMPSWKKVGAETWAEYSRHADLAVTGKTLYPFEGIGETVLTIAAALSFIRDGATPRRARAPIYLGAVMVIGVMLTTAKAAPFMLSVPKLSSAEAKERVLRGFYYWSKIRGGFQIAAFVANLWALTVR